MSKKSNIAKEGRTTAIISYLTIVGCLIAITMNMEPKNTFARFHIRQAFGIHILYHALAIAFSNLGLVWIPVGLFFLYLLLWGFGFINAMNEQIKLLPVLGEYFQKWFTFIS
ncbi:MAG: hypothetical protein ACFB0A_07425 [Croceivirga sp.]